MTKKVAIILAGSGVYDGTEIHEAILTFMALDKAGATVQNFAPNIKQMHVINHVDGSTTEETRSVLVESGRISREPRGPVKNLTEANPDDFDAVIVPGGFGVAKNLCDFAVKGADMTVNPEVLSFLQKMHAAKKPIGMMCIAPVLGPHIVKGASVTIGSDPDTSAAIEKMGGKHVAKKTNEAHVDVENKIVTTPAFMAPDKLHIIYEGIESLVSEVIKLA